MSDPYDTLSVSQDGADTINNDDDDDDDDDEDYDDDEDDDDDGDDDTDDAESRSCFTLNKIYLGFCYICIALSYLQAVLYMSIGAIILLKSGTLITDLFYLQYDIRLLSPLIPVWYNIQENVPFVEAFRYATIYAFIIMVFQSITVCLGVVVSQAEEGRHKEFTYVFIVITFIFGVTMISFVFLSDVYTNMGLDASQEETRVALSIRYKILTTDTFSTAMNMVMIMGECCGITGPDDFWRQTNLTISPSFNPYVGHTYSYIRDLPAWPKNKRWSGIVKVPPACCKRNLSTVVSDPWEDFKILVHCAQGGNGNLYYHEGCLSAVKRLYKANLESFFIIIHIIGGGLLVILSVATAVRMSLLSSAAKK